MQALVCQRCGGPLPEGANLRAATCPFCGTVNAPPPAVIESTVERIVVVAPANANASENGLRCPRCGVVMRELPVGATRVHGCGECAGVWLDPSGVDHARAVNDEELVRATALFAGVGLHARPDKAPLLSCPVCAKAMCRVTILGDACDVDVCAEHGTWFDRTELGSFVSAHSSDRAGDLSADELREAGIGEATSKGDIGFFGAMFELVGLVGK